MIRRFVKWLLQPLADDIVKRHVTQTAEDMDGVDARLEALSKAISQIRIEHPLHTELAGDLDDFLTAIRGEPWKSMKAWVEEFRADVKHSRNREREMMSRWKQHAALQEETIKELRAELTRVKNAGFVEAE